MNHKTEKVKPAVYKKTKVEIRQQFSRRNSKLNAVSCPCCPVECRQSRAAPLRVLDDSYCESRISRLEMGFRKIGGEQPTILSHSAQRFIS